EPQDLRGEERNHPLGPGEIAGFAVAARLRLAKNARRQLDGVDHPKLADAEARIELRLAPHVVASRGIRDLDNEQYVWTLEVFRLQRTWVNHHVRLEIGVLAEAECRFGGQFDSVGSRAEPPAQKRRLDDFVV